MTNVPEGAAIVSMILAGILSIAALAFYWKSVAGAVGMASSTNIFIAYQTLYLTGTFLAIDRGSGAQQYILWSTVTGVFCAVLGAKMVNATLRFRPVREFRIFQQTPLLVDTGRSWNILVIGSVLAAAVAAGTLYATRVGYNTFLAGLTRLLSEGVIDQHYYSRLRLNVSSGEYAAPGYANQFIAVLLPTLILILLAHQLRKRSFHLFILCTVLILADLYFLTITGSRGLVLKAFLPGAIALTAYGPLAGTSTRAKLYMLSFVLLMVGYYGVSTTVMGRTGAKDLDSANPLNVVEEFYDRTVGWQVKGQVIALEVLLSRDGVPVWGTEWWQTLSTVLPFDKQGRTFGNELHSILYSGNDAGAFNLEIWGSLLYNWGFAGIVIGGFLAGALLQYFTVAYIRGSRTLVRTVVLFVAGFHLGFVRDPFSLFLEGFISSIVLYVIFSISSTRAVSAAKLTGPYFLIQPEALLRANQQVNPRREPA